MNNTTTSSKENYPLKCGYDLPVLGLKDGSFNIIHISALASIAISLCSAVIVMVLSFSDKNRKTFFSRAKKERFIVYLAICDGFFNLFHGIDHLHYFIGRDHPRPKGLCELYSFGQMIFVNAQHLLVNIVAINVYMMMYFNKNLNFGRLDWKLLVWAFGVPFLAQIGAVLGGQLGPNGTYCGFDPIKGGITQILFTTVPLLIIISANIILYILTWKRIKEHVAGITESLKTSSVTDKSRYAARNMSLFVLAFFIQWFACAVFSIWLFFDKNVPMFLIIVNTTITNLGGTLNLGVCIILRHRDKDCDRKGKESQSNENEKYQLPNVSLEIASVEEKSTGGNTEKSGSDKSCKGLF